MSLQPSTAPWKLLGACILAVLCSAAQCADDAAAHGRSPGDMSDTERAAMMQAAHGYNSCVYEQALANFDADEDIRRIADLALGACQTHLDTLDGTIAGWGFPQYFATRFTRNVRDRAARKLLPELAIRKSQ